MALKKGRSGMVEPVRLVIWDLDDTFWRGTLTEGGITYDHSAHHTVIELARRGIMSSICSKNDFDRVKQILEEHEIWDYFIFPSINWEPKGPRIQSLIEAVQLRPETVLLIDDNPINLREALYFLPTLQTAAESIIPEILSNPLFKGKNDQGLSRLTQYKLLERRKADEAVALVATGSNRDFLRSCNIRVRIEYDLDKHIDRAVELVNRTNQLNFTKRRLPEDIEEARVELRKQIAPYHAQAGLVEVSDNYGNYGYCGFFLISTGVSGSRLTHFCFSCRILNMGVEAWLYQSLARPKLKITGEVLSDPTIADPVDWIAAISAADTEATASARRQFSFVATRGGCDLMPLGHYFNLLAQSIVGEYNLVRHGIAVRLDHSLCIRHAIEGVPPQALQAFQSLGYEPSDFQSRYFDHSGERPIWIFSNWMDTNVPVYRHIPTGVTIPFTVAGSRAVDLRNSTDTENRLANEYVRAALATLREQFDYEGLLTEEQVKDNLRTVFARVPKRGRMFVLLSLETRPDKDGSILTHRRHLELNRWSREAAQEFPSVELLPVAEFIEGPSEIQNSFNHFDRMVYFRIFQYIVRATGQPLNTGIDDIVPPQVLEVAAN
jgi:FkbH-like protein